MSAELSIVYENGPAWVLKDTRRKQYGVFRSGVTHSTGDCAFPLTDDGLSLAKARVDYLAKRSQADART